MSLCSLPIRTSLSLCVQLHHSKLVFCINSSRDIRCSVFLNVWMTSHHRWIKGETVKDSAVHLSSVCQLPMRHSSQETMLPLSRPVTHTDEFTRQDLPSCPAPCHAVPPLLSLLSVFHLCVFSISNHKNLSCIIHALPAPGGLSLELKGFWQRSAPD